MFSGPTKVDTGHVFLIIFVFILLCNIRKKKEENTHTISYAQNQNAYF